MSAAGLKPVPSLKVTGAQGLASRGVMKVPSPHCQQIVQMDAFMRTAQSKIKPEASSEEGWKGIKRTGAILQAAETVRKISINWDK